MYETEMKTKKKSENRTGIPTQLKERMEHSTCMSLDDVRVHYNSVLPARLNALAYTRGNQVEIGSGQEQQLPHELGHVIQQKLGLVRANGRLSGGVALNTDSGLEHQADEIGAGMSSLYARQNTEQDFEPVVQCKFDIKALIDSLQALIAQIALEKNEDLNNLNTELNGFKSENTESKDIKSVKTTLDKYKVFLDSKRKEIYDLFFQFYDMKVVQGNLEAYKRWHHVSTNINDEETELQDKNILVDALNDIYATKTGNHLLHSISNNKENEKDKEVTIWLGDWRGFSRDPKGNPKDEELGITENGEYQAGKGGGSSVYLGSPTLGSKLETNQDPEDIYPVVVAHELIHALHAQMGVKPTWEMLENAPSRISEDTGWMKSIWRNSKNYSHELFGFPSQKFPEFTDENGKRCYPDEVPTTGIRDDIVYPQPLEEIRHINENQIRRELDIPERTKY